METTTNIINVIHNGKSYAHIIVEDRRSDTIFLYIGDVLKDAQISFQADGRLRIYASHHTDEKSAQLIRKVIKSAGGTVESKMWWGGKDEGVVKRKKDATRYTQYVSIQHDTTTIDVTLFVDLA